MNSGPGYIRGYEIAYIRRAFAGELINMIAVAIQKKVTVTRNLLKLLEIKI
jgi:hypothetical protein